MGEFSIGQSVRRREDPRLLQGRGRYFDDLKLADQLHAAIVRSPHAHADIRGIDARAALQMPGVHAVLTGEDYRADGLGSLPSMAPYKRRDGGPMYLPQRPAIADRPRACTSAIRWRWWSPTRSTWRATPPSASSSTTRRGPPWCRRDDAFEPGAPQLYDDCPNNEAYFYQAGDKAAVDAAFARAAHVVEQRLVINRVTANPIEPRGVTGEYDAGTGRYTLHCGFQRPWLFRNDIARDHAQDSGGRAAADHRRHRRLLRAARLGLSGDHPDAVGGAPRRPAGEMDAAPATRRTSATTTRATTSSMPRSRSTATASSSPCGSAASAISAPSCRSAAPCRRWSTSARSAASTPRRRLHVAVSGMLTNTHCTSPYRGAGRPEASYMIERLIDIAADEMKIDPAELRRRNTIPPSAMPYKTPLTFTYDSGRFEENMDRAMKLADWRGFEARRKEAAQRGMLRGIGISNTIEQAADPTIETAEIRFDPLGGMTFVTGSISHGQGHATDPDADAGGPARRRSGAGSSSSRATPTRWPSAWAPAARARPP